MSLERKTAKRQIARMDGLDFFPQTLTGLKEIEDALMGFPGEQTCSEWVTEWLRTHEDFPKPAAVYGHLSALHRNQELAQESWRLAPRCPDCGDSGWRTVVKGGLSGAERCGCKGVGA